MKYLFIIFGILLILIVSLAIIGFIIDRSSKPHNERGGFRDWVKNPDYKKAVAEQFSLRQPDNTTTTKPDEDDDLGNIGTDESITRTLKALAAEDDYVRASAMMDIKRGIEAGRCTKEFLTAVFPALTKLLDRDDSSICGEAPTLLLAIDVEHALPILLSPRFFTPENSEVRYIIQALNADERKIPHKTLQHFLKTVKPLVDKYPHDYEYAAALIAYANNPDVVAEQTFRTELKSSNDKVQEAAATALAILSGVVHANKVIFDAVKDSGFDALSPPQQYYYAVLEYNGEVNNGGHSQYFVNSSGDHWKLALEGLKVIGAPQRAAILEKAVALFDTSGPSLDNDARHRQLADFSSQKDKGIDSLDTSYYSCKENVEVMLALYSIEEKSSFVKEPSE